MATAKPSLSFATLLLLTIALFVLLSCSVPAPEGGFMTTHHFVPYNITATPGAGTLKLSWAVEANDGWTAVVGFNIYIASQSGVTPDNYAALPDGRKIGSVSSPYTVTCLDPNKRYYFVITSRLATGIGGLPYSVGEGYPSAEVSATPLPAALAQPSIPTGLSASASVNQVSLSWTANAAGECIDSYTLHLATSPWTTWSDTLSGAQSITGIKYPYLTHSQLENGTTYWFSVTASNRMGSSNESPQVSSTPESIPTSISFDLNDDGRFGDEVSAQSRDAMVTGAKRTYKALIKNQAGTPMSGVVLDWVSSISAVATTTPTSTVTDANGIATTTIDALTTGDTTVAIADTSLLASNSISLRVANKLSNITSASAGLYHTCATTLNGSAKCWGLNEWGRLGDGTQTNSSTPVDVVGLETGTSDISSGQSHTCAIVSGTPKCWGFNNHGQLGRSDLLYSMIATDIMGLTEASSISAAGSHTCALTTTGGVKCWGYNYSGELGNGSFTDSYTPIDVIGLESGVTAISSGSNHTCALTTSGSVKCWGNNANGELGNGTTTTSNTPVDVTGLSNGVVAISAGANHSCAITSTGGIKCWGNNFYGQLGNGTTSEALLPVDVTDLIKDVSSISAGSWHMCAITNSGVVKCWGSNKYGQLGNGTYTYTHTPQDVSGLGGEVSSVTAGYQYTCAVITSGELQCWGDGAYEKIGDGTRLNRLYPVYVIAQ